MGVAPAEVTVAVAQNDTPVLVAIARLEGKVDATLAVHGSDITTLRTARDDHEARLRTQEARKTVAPRDLWLGIGASIASAAGLAQLFRVLFPS